MSDRVLVMVAERGPDGIPCPRCGHSVLVPAGAESLLDEGGTLLCLECARALHAAHPEEFAEGQPWP